MTFHWRGITSSVSVTSSPSFDRRSEPQPAQQAGLGITTRVRGRCAGNGWRDGLLRNERGDGRGLGGGDRGGGFVLAGGHLGGFERQLELIDQPLAAFRALAEAVTLEQLDLQRLKCDAGLEIGVDRAGVGGIGAGYSGLYLCLIGTHHRDCKLLSERDNIGRR